MFQKTGSKHKVEEFVEITVANQPPFEAVVFLSMGDRLVDLLNDTRNFIPVKRMDNSTVILAKSTIISIVEKDPFNNHDSVYSQGNVGNDLTPQYDDEDEDLGSDQDKQGENADASAQTKENKDDVNKRKRTHRRRRRNNNFDAYAILKVSPEADLEEIRKAYKIRIKAVHPDSVAALDLDPELIKAAIQSTQKVNYAYHHILKERKAMAGSDEAAA